MEMTQAQRAKQHRIIPPDEPTAVPANLEMFVCVKRNNLRLSTAGCGRAWDAGNKAKPPEPWLGIAACRGCSIGEANSTGIPPDPGAALRERVFRICSRCGQIQERRIIHIKTLGLCISCYNRHREAMIGRDARGHTPALKRLLHTEEALVTTPDGSSRILIRHHVLLFEELVRQEQRNAMVAMSFTKVVTIYGSRTVSKNSAIGTLTDAVMLSGVGVNSNSAAGDDLTETLPLSGCGTSGDEAAAVLRPRRRRRPRMDPNVEPVTDWMPRNVEPVTSWIDG